MIQTGYLQNQVNSITAYTSLLGALLMHVLSSRNKWQQLLIQGMEGWN